MPPQKLHEGQLLILQIREIGAAVLLQDNLFVSKSTAATDHIAGQPQISMQLSIYLSMLLSHGKLADALVKVSGVEEERQRRFSRILEIKQIAGC